MLQTDINFSQNYLDQYPDISDTSYAGPEDRIVWTFLLATFRLHLHQVVVTGDNGNGEEEDSDNCQDHQSEIN